MTEAPRGPSVFAILFAIIAATIALTWAIPGGRYATVRYDAAGRTLVVDDGGGTRSLPPTQASLDHLGVRASLARMIDGSTDKPVSVPGSYRRIGAMPASPLAILTAPVAGTVAAADVIFFVLTIGGFVGLFNASGAFDAGLAALTRKLKGREDWLIVIVTLLLAGAGAAEGMAEETLAFYPLLMPVFAAAGYDRMVPLAVILGGSQIGCAGSMTNPFSTIIASAAAGVPWTDGIAGRTIVWVAGVTAMIAWTLRYARKVRRDPSLSLAPADAPAPGLAEIHQGPVPPMEPRIRALLALLPLVFGLMIYGVSRLGWWFPEMTALFLGASIVAGVLQPPGGRIDAFIVGARELLGVALVIGLARGVSVVLSASHIDATLIDRAGSALAGVPGAAFLIGALLLFFGLTFVVPSTSGLAVLTMPLLAPVAAHVGAPVTGLVSAYVFGSGIMNVVTPSGVPLPSTAMAGVGFGAWLRFVWPVLAITGAVSALVLAAGL